MHCGNCLCHKPNLWSFILFYELQEFNLATQRLRLLSVLRWWFCCCWLIVYCCSHCLWGGGGGFCVLSLFCYAVLSILSSFAITLLRNIELFALLELFSRWLVAVSVLFPFLTVPWVGLQCVIVVFYDHTHSLKGTQEDIYVFQLNFSKSVPSLRGMVVLTWFIAPHHQL